MGHYNKPGKHSGDQGQPWSRAGPVKTDTVSRAVGPYGLAIHPAEAPAGARAGGWWGKNGKRGAGMGGTAQQTKSHCHDRQVMDLCHPVLSVLLVLRSLLVCLVR